MNAAKINTDIIWINAVLVDERVRSAAIAPGPLLRPQIVFWAAREQNQTEPSGAPINEIKKQTKIRSKIYETIGTQQCEQNGKKRKTESIIFWEEFFFEKSELSEFVIRTLASIRADLLTAFIPVQDRAAAMVLVQYIRRSRITGSIIFHLLFIAGRLPGDGCLHCNLATKETAGLTSEKWARFFSSPLPGAVRLVKNQSLVFALFDCSTLIAGSLSLRLAFLVEGISP